MHDVGMNMSQLAMSVKQVDDTRRMTRSRATRKPSRPTTTPSAP